MAEIVNSRKNVAVNPLKMSAPLGASMAFMGLDGCMPVLHGSQGCTAFGLVLLVRHFKEAIPFQTTAMSEVTTILGGSDNLEQAILNIHSRAKPKVIAIASTGLVETRGEDVAGDLRAIRKRHPELDDMGLIYVSTPDFAGAFQDGWAKAVNAVIASWVDGPAPTVKGKVNILAGCHLTPADIEEIRDLVEMFGLDAVILPDLSGSLDGHVPEDWVATTFGGTTREQVASMAQAEITLAIGEQMRLTAQNLEKLTNVPFQVFDRLTGLLPMDAFIKALADISGKPVPAKLKRQRSQLVDAMLDGHFHFGHKRVALAAEPDLLHALAHFFADMGAHIVTAVTTTQSPILAGLPVAEVVIGDLEDFEASAKAEGAQMLVTHSHGRQAAERLGLPLVRMGFPCFDHLGAAHKLSVGYRGSRDLIFQLANVFIENLPHHHPGDWDDELPQGDAHHGGAHAAA